MDAVIYTSNTGFTEQYAKLLSEAIGAPAYSLKEAGNVKQNADVIYLGWISASMVQGYKKAAKKYNVKAVCAVGMGRGDGQLDDVKKANSISDKPVFMLQGGFDMNKLKGIYRFMMKTMARTAGKALAEKTDRTPDEDDMLDLMQNGGSRVDISNLAPVIAWCEANK